MHLLRKFKCGETAADPSGVKSIRRAPAVAVRGAALAATAVVVIIAGCAPTPPPETATAPSESAPPTTVATFDCVGRAESRVGTAAASTPTPAEAPATRTQPAITLTAVGQDGAPDFVTVTPDGLVDAFIAMSAQNVQVVAAEFEQTVSTSRSISADPLSTTDRLWGVSAMRFPELWTAGATGSTVTVAVVDTGVDANHPDLCGNVRAGASFLSGSTTSLGPGVGDDNGHGTHVAGVIAATKGNGIGITGVAPSTVILPVKVLNRNGDGEIGDLARGITWAADNGADVINLSLGSASSSAAVRTAVDYATGRGALVVAAGGNKALRSSPNAPQYPAADANTVAVAALAPDLTVAWFSVRGNYIDVAAPGQDILSTLPGDRYGVMSGTSMATPFVSGAAAALLGKRPALSPAQLSDALSATATDRGTVGRDSEYGNGVLDPPAALASVTSG